MDTHPFVDNLLKQAEENPILAMGTVAALITSIAQLVTAHGRRKGSLAFAKQVDHRIKRHK